MYFKGVNRGVTFTKAGFYLTGFVLLLGFFATGSGSNGFFLALGFGLSVLVISGLLSEKIMKHVDCLGFSEAVAEPNVPFAVTFQMKNSSDGEMALGVEALVYATLPRFRLRPGEIPPLIRSAPLALAPGQTAATPGTGKGLARGMHRDFFLVERTLHPFGLFYKFKVRSLQSRVLVLPEFDASFADELTLELRQLLQVQAQPEDFHSHRPLVYGDSHRRVDWKKSAGFAVAQWSIKVFEAPMPRFGVRLVALESGIFNELAYERWLVRLRTAVDVVTAAGRSICLQLPRGATVSGREGCLEALAVVPAFLAKEVPSPRLSSEAAAPGWYLALTVETHSHRWAATPEFFGDSA